MAERPRKRIKANPFVDIEAVVDEDELSDDEADFLAEGDVDLDEDEVLWDSVHRHVQLARERADAASDVDWANFLKRAFDRSRGLQSEADVSRDAEPAGVWEVGCKSGKEALVASQCPLDDDGKPTVVALPALPGKVFVFAPNLDVVSQVANKFSDLNNSVIRHVPAERLYSVISTLSSVMPFPRWARVRSNGTKWKLYRGDVGMAVNMRDQNVLLLLPRLGITYESPVKGRPCQSLLDFTQLQFLKRPGKVISNEDGTLNYKRRLFTQTGLLIVPLEDIDVILTDSVIPTHAEFEKFVKACAVSSALYRRTRMHLTRGTLRVGDRVKIFGGDLVDLCGYIVDVLEEDYLVDFPSIGLQYNIEHRYVRSYYRAGDRVKILSGAYSGCVGWVVDIDMDWYIPNAPEGEYDLDLKITVVNHDIGLEVQLRASLLEFYDDERDTNTLRPLKRNKVLGGKDPNEVYIGKRIMVVGGHRLKGYLGLVRKTTPQGIATVEMDATHRMEEVELAHLAFAKNKLETAWDKPAESPTDVTYPAAPTGQHAAAPTDHVPEDDLPCPEPIPPCELSIGRPWILDDALPTSALRAKVRERGYKQEPVNVLSVDGSRVCIFDRFSQKSSWVDAADLAPAHPTATKQMVTPLVGDLKGKSFVVKHYNVQQCVVHEPGKRLRKGEKDPEFRTVHLAQVNGRSR